MDIPKVAIIGRPNVGKSTLFNRLVGQKKAIMSDEPGTTRDKVSFELSWNGKDFLLVDTAGVLSETFNDDGDIERLAQEKVIEVLSSSDLVLFVVDGKEGVVDQDKEVAKLLRRVSDKVLVVANKLDTAESEKTTQIQSMGFADIVSVSAITGRRCAGLLDNIAKRLPAYKKVKQQLPVMTIIGRPNVGKSTLFNEIVGRDLSIVSDVPGTTRDSVQAQFNNRKGDKFIIYDTAGYRRRGKIKPGVERFSIYRTLDAIVSSDLVLVVMDASEGITRQDAHLVQLALDHRKKVIIVLNKIDKLKNESTEEIEHFYRYKFISKQVIVGVSALSKKNLGMLLKEVDGKLFS